MIESIAIRLTIWQATTAIVTLLVSLCSLIWTVYSKCEDWKIAKADKTEREQSEGENNASTAEKLEYHRQRVDKLEKELQQALNDNNALKKQWQGSYQRLIQTQANMNARLNIMEKDRRKCNLIKSNDIDPLATKINIVEAATKELSGDFDNAIKSAQEEKEEEEKTFQQLRTTISTVKSCQCASKMPPSVVSIGTSTQPDGVKLSRTASSRSSMAKRKPWSSDFRKSE